MLCKAINIMGGLGPPEVTAVLPMTRHRRSDNTNPGFKFTRELNHLLNIIMMVL